MKIGIICKKDGDPETCLPIIKADENGEPTQSMAVWDSWSDAREWAYDSMLCRASEVLFIDLENNEIRE